MSTIVDGQVNLYTPQRPSRRILSVNRNQVSITWPPGGTADLTVVFGVASISAAAPPPPLGSLRLDNTNGTDAAHAFMNVTPAAIVASVQTMTSPLQTGATGLQGLFVRGDLQPVPGILRNGYRLDYFNPTLRLIRFDAGVVGAITTLDLTGFDGGYYTTLANPITYNLEDNGAGNLMQGFLSAPGRLDTGFVSFAGATTAPHPSGRIGFLMFQNLPGSGPGFFSAYSATWST